MSKVKKAKWYTIISAGVVFSVLACSSSQAKSMLQSYEAGDVNRSITATKSSSNKIMLTFKASKAFKDSRSKAINKLPSVGSKAKVNVKTIIYPLKGKYKITASVGDSPPSSVTGRYNFTGSLRPEGCYLSTCRTASGSYCNETGPKGTCLIRTEVAETRAYVP
jgi:hypothetical protein